MKKSKRVVIGKYQNPEDVKAALQRLERDNYTRDDVSLYTNNSNLEKFEEMYDIDMLADETKTVEDTDNESLWDKMKQMVSYDHDEGPLFDEDEEELLAPYKEDLKNGYTVIAVREREKPATEEITEESDYASVLYETDQEMKGAEVSEVADDTYQADNLNGVDETNHAKADVEATHFYNPEDYESDVTGDDYVDTEENKEQ